MNTYLLYGPGKQTVRVHADSKRQAEGATYFYREVGGSLRSNLVAVAPATWAWVQK